MLLKATALRSSDPAPTLQAMARELTAYGQRNITCATDFRHADYAAEAQRVAAAAVAKGYDAIRAAHRGSGPDQG